MKKITIAFFCLSMFLGSFAQELDKFKVDTSSAALAAKDKIWREQLADLYDAGIRRTKDSMHISAESKRVIQDTAYRSLIFPAAYTWPKAIDFLEKKELKKGFWYLIKMYEQDTANRNLVIRSLLTFDNAFKLDQVLISTFYTYAFLDPLVGSFKNNKLQIDHPDILEKEFNKVKEMIAYISVNRKTAVSTKEKDR